MPLSEADLMVDRRRLKRQISLWRLASILLAVAVIAVAGSRLGKDVIAPSHVGRFVVSGVITDEPLRVRALEEAAKDGRLKALIVRIDSPGGTVVGSEELYRRLRALGVRIPVVAVLGQTAASGGYMTALGADWIVAREGTITGSIGVLMQSPDVSRLLEKLGIQMDVLKSSPLKAVPNPFEPLTDEGRRAVQGIIDDTHAMFVGMVAERRKLAPEEAQRVADGRVFTGRQAKELKLVDALGGEETARSWLASERGIDRSLPVRDVKISREDQLWRDLTSRIATAVMGKSYLPERLTLDGLVALWHPELGPR